jgi:crotonobetainyl-CoA:carnitine CoA-transferase CaiB-like acyl-CoA transferase
MTNRTPARERPGAMRWRRGSYLRFVGAAVPILRRPPALGEHNEEILGPLMAENPMRIESAS